MRFNEWREKERGATAAASLRQEALEPGLAVLRPGRLEALPDWARRHAEPIKVALAGHGAVLLRGLAAGSVEDFQAFVEAVLGQTASYIEGATPRTAIGKGVYTSTEFPAEETIALHNELSYVTRPPSTICFFCVTAAASGGETPVADVRRVLSLIDPAIVAEFEARGWQLVRNYGLGFGPSAQSALGVDTPEGIRAYCRRNDVELVKLDGKKVRTAQRRSAVHRHPRTGERLWFNHVAFWHHSSLPSSIYETLRSCLAFDELPYATMFGDGGPIPDSYIENISRAYAAAKIEFEWQAGDLLLLDNWRFAHGRNPFAGPRKILVAMS